MDYTTIISQVMMIVGVLTILVNIITEVIKKSFTWCSSSKVINIFVLILSVMLTVTVFFAYCQIKELAMTWYAIAAFIIIGFLVAYAAMFGYDKLLQYFEKAGE